MTATFPAPGLRRPLNGWQRRVVCRLLQAGAQGISADDDLFRRTPGALRFTRFLRERGMVMLVEDRRIVACDRRGLAELLAADDE